MEVVPSVMVRVAVVMGEPSWGTKSDNDILYVHKEKKFNKDY